MKKFLLPIGVILAVVGMVGLGVLLRKDEPAPPQTLSSKIEANEHVLGNPTAKVQLIEYGDIQCPACASFAPSIERLMKENSDWIYFSFRHLPLNSIHKNADEGARAVEAAGLQGKFFEMVNLMYGKQSEWSAMPDPGGKIQEYASQLQLDSGKFLSDYNSAAVKDRIASDLATAELAGFNSTPTLVVNGKKIANPSSYEKLLELLKAENVD
jgi:protein-disulfide isomerase